MEEQDDVDVHINDLRLAIGRFKERVRELEERRERLREDYELIPPIPGIPALIWRVRDRFHDWQMRRLRKRQDFCRRKAGEYEFRIVLLEGGINVYEEGG